jgi:hypothetical protein
VNNCKCVRLSVVGDCDDLQFNAAIVLANKYQSIPKFDRINRIDNELNVRHPDPVMTARSNHPYTFHVEYVIRARQIFMSEPIPAGLESMRVASPAVGGGGGVTPDHFPRAPTGQPHQVVLLTAGGQPVVGEGVPELVRVHRWNPRVYAPPFQHLAHPRVGHTPLLAEPERRRVRGVVTTTETQVTAQRIRCLRPKGAGTVSPTFAEHQRNLMLEINVLHSQPAQLARSHAGVEE